MRTKYLRTVTIRDGYAGHTQPLYLCEGEDGVVWGVHRSGYITFADPRQGIGPLPIDYDAMERDAAQLEVGQF